MRNWAFDTRYVNIICQSSRTRMRCLVGAVLNKQKKKKEMKKLATKKIEEVSCKTDWESLHQKRKTWCEKNEIKTRIEQTALSYREVKQMLVKENWKVNQHKSEEFGHMLCHYIAEMLIALTSTVIVRWVLPEFICQLFLCLCPFFAMFIIIVIIIIPATAERRYL